MLQLYFDFLLIYTYLKMFKLRWICDFVLLLIVANVAKGDSVIPKNTIEDKLLTLLLQWRDGCKLPVSLPPLNDIILNGLEGSYDAKGVQFSYSTSELQLRGLNNFSVVEFDVSEKKLQASGRVVIPMVLVSAENYKLQGRAYYMYTLKGSGRLKVTIRNIKMLFAIHLVTKGLTTNIAELDLDFVVGSIEADLENSSWPINKLLNAEGVRVLNGYHDNIINKTKTILIQRLDDVFTTVSPKQLLSLISNNY